MSGRPKPAAGRFLLLLLASLWLTAPAPGRAAIAAPSAPGVDAPELARLGRFSVGVRRVGLRPRPGEAARRLEALVWYPAARTRGPAAVYRAALPSETPGRWARFTIPGLAVRDARPDRSARRPMVILSHGYSGDPAALSWLGENLASKGYVVVAPWHRDPPITDPAGFPGVAAQRPLDVVFAARAAPREPFLAPLVDPTRVVLIGYSMGGYGALTAAGAGLSPEAAARTPGGRLVPFARGGTRRADLRVPGVKAVVAISPAGGGGAFTAWGPEGLAELKVPMLLLVGDRDRVVGYAPGVADVFRQAVKAPRWMLVFREAGHSIGMDPAPPQMRRKLWDLDWFEDPVWRKARVIEVSLHMITAFLDLEVGGRADRAAYLAGPTVSDDGVWTAPAHPYDAYSPVAGGVTVWKGFQRNHESGLELLRAGPGSGPAAPR